jgi:hypothetical protein
MPVTAMRVCLRTLLFAKRSCMALDGKDTYFGLLITKSPIMHRATASMTAVEIHPSTHCGRGIRNPPVRLRLVVISMMMAIIGPAKTPFTTALQKSA